MTDKIDMTHMVQPSTFAGGNGNKKFCVEGRDPYTGHLDSSVTLPFMEATVNQLCDHYFKMNPDKSKASQEEICEWYNSRSIFFRLKTW